MLASVFTNSFNEFDVTDDGFVVAEDVLNIINYINAKGSGKLPVANNDPAKFIDVNGDGQAVADDVLTVINAINAGNLPGLLALTEQGAFSEEVTKTFDLPAVGTGSRTIQFDLATRFDVGVNGAAPDQILVYLVDPASPSDTLLDQGENGTTVFSLVGSKADYLPGMVRYDGNTVQIDTTTLDFSGLVALKFQLIDSDGSFRSRMVTRSLTVVTDSEGLASPAFVAAAQAVAAYGPIDTGSLSPTTDVGVNFSNIRFDPSVGAYTSELSVTGLVNGLGRTIVVTFPGLPSGVTFMNPTGTTLAGVPYINLSSAIPQGGLLRGSRSSGVEVEFNNPSNTRFTLKPQVLVGLPNRAPVFATIDTLTVMPGGVLDVPLSATDPDGDPVTFSIRSDESLPNITLTSMGHLVVRPAPGQEKSYELELIATDGIASSSQVVTLDVVSDPITTTRVSGRILRTSGQPLANVKVEVGAVQGFSTLDGSFLLDLGSGPVVSDTLKIRGEIVTGPAKYPFIAEKLAFILEHPVYTAVKNVIDRPIYLPALDVENAVPIDPQEDIIVTTPAIPGVALYVAAGTLMNQQGTPFTGELTITEVPADLTPAALPDNLIPDLVVTIQPGEMVFATPAPLSFPNRANYPPGTIFDLWSINPVTGEFDDVGDAAVSPDGQQIDTVEGGVRNSSWHFVGPPPGTPDNPDGNPLNQEEGCHNPDELNCPGNSTIEMHSGAVIEKHDLVTYQSLGQTRGVSLTYHSQRAYPTPIVHLGYSNLASLAGDGDRLVASLSVKRGDFDMQVPGYTDSFPGLRQGQHFWKLSSQPRNIDIALQADLTQQPSGIYDFQFSSGRMALLGDGSGYTGTLSDSSHKRPIVNSINSVFGAGWGITGVQQIVENPGGALLLIDGGGSQLVYQKGQGNDYVSPPGDFTTMNKQADGTYRRRTPDGTVHVFDSAGRSTSVTDRNGNQTTHEYNDLGIAKITDPAGLFTTFQYTNGKVSAIIDPANRETQLEYDGDDLVRVIDPDDATRTWNYNDRHLMTGETDQRGLDESTLYDSAGRAFRSIQTDDTEIKYTNLQTSTFIADTSPLSPDTALLAPPRPFTEVTYVTPSGNTSQIQLDRAGQAILSRDGIGSSGLVRRNAQNLVTNALDARGNRQFYVYDSGGYPISQTDTILPSSQLFPAPQFPLGSFPSSMATGDVNGDGRLDVVTANPTPLSDNVSVLLGDGAGGFPDAQNFAVGRNPRSVALGDINGDGRLDLVTANDGYSGGRFGVSSVSVLLGDGSGGFAAALDFPLEAGATPNFVALGDVNGDSRPDLVTTNITSNHVYLLLGDGAGGFGPAQLLAVGSNPYSVAFGDVNGDGRVDLVTANIGSNVSVRLGDGAGGFAAVRNFPVGSRPASVALGDVNGDGQTDLVTANSNSNNVSVLLGDGAGGFAEAQNFLVGSYPSSVALGDVNVDGRLDLMTGNLESSNVSVLLGDGSGGFAAAQNFLVGSAPSSVALGDLDGDGQLGLLVANGSGSVTVLLGDGTGGFASAPNFAVGSRPNSVALGDVNGDGRRDLVTANRDASSLSVLLGDGAGGFAPAQNRAVFSDPDSVALGDVNGDGRLDFVTTMFQTDRVRVTLGDGSGGFSTARNLAVGDQPESVALGDLNDDGRLDVVTANRASNNVSVLLGDGSGNFAAAQNFAVGSSPSSVALGDVNGDGRLDLVAANFTSTNVSVLLGDGAGGFAAAQNFAVGSAPFSVAIGDANEDGRLDLVTANLFGNVNVLLGDGSGGFAATLTFPLAFGATPESVALGDVNGDGRVDLVTANSSGNVSVLLGDGAGGFVAEQSFAAGSASSSIVLGDINGDKRLDLVTANSGSNDVTLLLNLAPTTTLVTRSFTYDSTFHQLTSATDERGNTTAFAIDPANGNILSATRPAGQTATYTYTASGQINTLTGSLGRITDYDYDSHGRVTQVTYAKGTADQGIVQYEYDNAGNRTAAIDENNRRTEYVYDVRNRLKLVRDALGNETAYTYDQRGNVTQARDSLGQTISNTYDERNRLTSTTDAQGNITRFKYDTDGNVIGIIDPLGHVTRHKYDARNRRIETTDADGGKTQFRYDAADNLITLTDPVGNRTRFFYDGRNRLIKETDPLGSSILYSYDAADNLIQKTDRNGRVTKYEYDALNRLTKETWVGDGNVITYAYDTESQLLSVADNFGKLTYAYDARYRIKSVDNHGSQAGGTPAAPRVLVEYAYDPAGNVLSVIDTINGAAAATTGYLYDALDRLSKLTQAAAPDATGIFPVQDKRVDFTYNAIGQYDHIQRFSDLAGSQTVIDTAYAYDNLNRLTSIDHKNAGGTPVSFFHYQYDAASRITQISDIDGATTYAYDNRDQLTAANRADPNNPDEAYRYDANGNRTQSHLPGSGYLTGPGNRLLSDGTYDYQYDAEGNTTKRTEKSTGNYRLFTWDHRNRLTAVIDNLANGTPTQIVAFAYDPLDRRILKSVDTTPTDAVDAALTYFIYDREDVILDFVVADGPAGLTATLSQRYLHGPGIDQVLAQESFPLPLGEGQGGASAVHWHLTDHLSTVRDLANTNGVIANHILYDSFGNALAESDDTIRSRYLFTSREFDHETGLHFYRARYYNSQSGRFLSEDPLQAAAVDRNLFRYAVNSPLAATDPFGLNAIYLVDKEGVPGTGHAAVLIGDDENGWVFAEFYPTGESAVGALYATGGKTKLTFQTLEEARAALRQFDAYLYWKTTQGQDAKALNRIDRDDPIYSLPNYHCGDFAEEVLGEAGISLKKFNPLFPRTPLNLYVGSLPSGAKPYKW